MLSHARMLGLLFLAACAPSQRPAAVEPAASTTVAAPEPTIVGTYVVEQVNGAPLPARLREYPGGHTELVSGGLELRLDGTFVETGAVRLVAGAVSNTNTHTATGRYTIDGARVVLTYTQGGRMVTGTASLPRLTVTAGSMTIIYLRR